MILVSKISHQFNENQTQLGLAHTRLIFKFWLAHRISVVFATGFFV